MTSRYNSGGHLKDDPRDADLARVLDGNPLMTAREVAEIANFPIIYVKSFLARKNRRCAPENIYIYQLTIEQRSFLHTESSKLGITPSEFVLTLISDAMP